MIQAKVKLTFEQFLEQYPEDGIYELVNGKIIEVEPTRAHNAKSTINTPFILFLSSSLLSSSLCALCAFAVHFYSYRR